MDQIPEEPQDFAERLRFLLGAVRHPEGRPYNLSEIAEEIARRGRARVSRGYLSSLKDGKKRRPSPEYVEAIADFFGVPLMYFYDSETARWVEQELRLIASLRSAGVHHLSLEAYGLSPSSLEVIAETVRHLRRLEGLPETSEEPPRRRRRRERPHEPPGAGHPAQDPAPDR